jgi:hypothetical protein
MANLNCFSESDEDTINVLPIDNSSRRLHSQHGSQSLSECSKEKDTHWPTRPRKRRTHSIAEGRYRDGLRFRMHTLQVLVEDIMEQDPELLGMDIFAKGSTKPTMLAVARELLMKLHGRIDEAVQTRSASRAEFDEYAAKANCETCPTAAYARKHYFTGTRAWPSPLQSDDLTASSNCFMEERRNSD